MLRLCARVGIAAPNLDALTGLVRLKARTLGLYPPASPGDERNPQ